MLRDKMFIHSLRFLLVLVPLFVYADWASNRGGGYRGETAIRFDSMLESEVISRSGLSRRQLINLKIGYLETRAEENSLPYEIGLFGTHQIKYFSSTSFGYPFTNDHVFNFWSGANRLEDMGNYLEFLEGIGQLPKNIFVTITTPNNDNGRAIIGGDSNMPIDFKYNIEDDLYQVANGDFDAAVRFVKYFPAWVETKAKFNLNYINFFIGMFGGNQVSVIDLNLCEKLNNSTIQSLPETKGMLDFVILRLPLTIRTALGKPDMKAMCNWDRLHGANRPDGSSLNHITTPPKINKNPLVDGNSGLGKGDEELIVKGWARIHSIAMRNNRNIIYFVPPVYETKRNGLANRIFDDALNIMNDKYPEIIDRFIDDRYAGRGRPDIFVSYDHPNETYYKELIERAYDRKLLNKSALPPVLSGD